MLTPQQGLSTAATGNPSAPVVVAAEYLGKAPLRAPRSTIYDKDMGLAAPD
jgi:hypothetical protein